MPSALPHLSRRQVLAGAGRAAAGVLVVSATGAAVSACGSQEPPKIDDLEAQLTSARDDSDLARAAAAAAPPAIAPALTQVASERSEHARALADEIARAAGRPAPTSETMTTATTAGATGTSGASTPPPPPPSVKDVVTALRASADSAAKLAPTLSGYRAGLLGSIAASCTAAYTVALVTPRPVS